MAEIRVFVISGTLEGSLCFIISHPPPPPHMCVGRGRRGGKWQSCSPASGNLPRPSSSLSSLSSLTFCVMTVLPLTPHPSLCLAFRRMPEFQPSLAASVTYHVNYSLSPGVQRKVQSCLSHFASRSSQLGCWLVWLSGSASQGFLLVPSFAHGFFLLPLCLCVWRAPLPGSGCHPSHWPIKETCTELPDSLTLLLSCSTSQSASYPHHWRS